VRRGRLIGVGAIAAAAGLLAAPAAGAVSVGELRLPAANMAKLQRDWVDQLMARYPMHSWAPMRFNLRNRDLRLMGLPPKRVLLAHRYRVPTAVYPDGRIVRLTAKNGGKGGGKSGGGAASSPGLVTYAGAGFFGIRPGAWLLLINGNSIGWCSMAHVYGAPGSYEISTAGHCGKPGDIGTVIGALSNKTVNGLPVPVLIDFGSFQTVHDAGLGND